MSTFDSKIIIDKMIENNGYYETDPRVYMIVEYTNQAGNRAWGVTWETESPSRRERYLKEDGLFIMEPKLIWRQP